MKTLPRIALVASCLAPLAGAPASASAASQALVRGPFLQSTSSSGVTLACRTDEPVAVTLRWAEHAGPPWTGVRESAAGTTHEFALAGLRPDTTYRYQLAAGTTRLAGGDDCTFRTAPAPASRAPFRFMAWGDAGSGLAGQYELAARMPDTLPPPAFVLGLGDLVYEYGEWEHYDPRIFRPYAPLFRSATFWPAFGNHDARTDGGAPYFDAFLLPRGTGAPGHPSATERYYSFDHGMAHFTCLDTEGSDTTPGGPQHAWLAADLEHARVRGARWLFVFMHHPPYSHGSHNSTDEAELIRIREDFVPLFDSKGVDVVLVGHSHAYERSYLLQGDAILQGDASDYTKLGTREGTLYVVSGCAGKRNISGTLDHPLMARSYEGVLGFNVFDVGWDALEGRFIEVDGRTTDVFTLRKGTDPQRPRVAAVEARAPDRVALVFDEPVRGDAGPSGAENATLYSLDLSASVLGARLDGDGRTVELTTTPLAPDLAYTLAVRGVADVAGLAADDSARFVLPRSESLGGVQLVPPGATWRYSRGTSSPGAAWTQPGFDDSGWGRGPAGFGYDDGDDATRLADMKGGYATVYARIPFGVPVPERVAALRFGAWYDDGFVAYLNGVEIARVNVPIGQTHATLAGRSYEAERVEWFDASAARDALVPGTNVLAVEGHNSSLSSNDFSLHPVLEAVLGRVAGEPRAVLHAPVRTANAPARLAFSGALSTDAEGPLASFSWDFGDGAARASGPEVEHAFSGPGIYDVTLVVRDADGLESLARETVRVHSEGLAPLAEAFADATRVPRGSRVRFHAGTSRDPDGGAVTYHWDFGDPRSGPRNVAPTHSRLHRYRDPGLYVATLVVTDDEGSAASVRVSIRVD